MQDDISDRQLLNTLLEADAELAAVNPADAYSLYQLLHRIADRIACAEAFYLCLYNPSGDTLFFPFNYDAGVYDPPATLPMGDGPTSQVVRRKRPFVWNTEEEARHVGGVHFGDMESLTLSAVHVPIFRPNAGYEQAVLGVLSAHSYRPGVYTPPIVRAYQWLANRAGLMLAYAEAATQADASERRVQVMADHCVQTLHQIGHEAQAVHRLTPPASAPLKAAVEALRQSCWRRQTEISQAPLHIHEAPAAPPAPDPLACLTKRERELLRLLADGHSNAEIAGRLFIAVDTVKDHLKSIYGKLGVKSRTQAAQKLRAVPE